MSRRPTSADRRRAQLARRVTALEALEGRSLISDSLLSLSLGTIAAAGSVITAARAGEPEGATARRRRSHWDRDVEPPAVAAEAAASGAAGPRAAAASAATGDWLGLIETPSESGADPPAPAARASTAAPGPPSQGGAGAARGEITPLRLPPPPDTTSWAGGPLATSAASSDGVASASAAPGLSGDAGAAGYSGGSSGGGYSGGSGGTVTVTLETVDGYASESGDTGQIKVVRSGGDTSQSLTVYLHASGGGYSGGATPSVDYTTSPDILSSNSVVIPGGSTSRIITITPIDDSLVEGTETAGFVLDLDPGYPSRYVIGDPNGASVSIADNDGSGGGGGPGDDGSATDNNRDRDSDPDQPGYCPGDGIDPQSGQFFYYPDGNGQPYCGAPRPGYNSSTNPHPIVTAEWTIPAGQAVPDKVAAKLTFGGVAGTSVYYATGGLSAGQRVRFALQVDASALPTGRHDWTIDVTSYRGASTATDQISGGGEIFNRIASPYGNRWWITDLDRIAPRVGGVALIRGDATAGWFADGGSGGSGGSGGGGYVTPAGSSTRLAHAASGGGWVLTKADGGRSEFNAAGLLTARVDRNGNSTSYAYIDADGDGKAEELSQATDPYGRTAAYAYAGGLLQSMTDYAGRTTTFAYTSGKLTSLTQVDPDGSGPLTSSVTTFAYDGNGLMTKATDPAGLVTTITYDSALRARSIQRPGGGTRQVAPVVVRGLVDPASGLGTAANPAPMSLPSDAKATIIDATNRTTTLKTDRFGGVVEEVDPLGNVTAYERDADGRVTKITRPDPDGAGPLTAPVTSYNYDAKGNLTGSTLPDGLARAWTYDATYNQPTSYRDEDGRTTTYTLDAKGNRLTEVDPLGRTTTYAYDSRGQATSVTRPDPDGAGPLVAPTTSFAYDSRGRMTTITYPGGATRKFAYDAADNRVGAVDELGRTTTYAYDAMGRATTVTAPDPDGAGPLTSPVTSYAYRADGMPSRVTDPLGRVTTYSYDAAGRLASVTDPDPDGAGPLTAPVTSYDYDAEDRPTRVTDPLGRVTTFNYDSGGRLASVVRPDPDGAGPLTSPVTTYTYDNLGRLTAETDPLGRVTTFAYDVRDRLTTVTAPDPDGAGPLSSPVTRYGYDAVGRQATVVDPLNRTTTSVHDAAGQLIKVVRPDPDGAGPLTSPVTTYTYDNLGRVTSVVDPLGRTTTFAYDSRDRLTTITAPDPDGAGPLASPVTKYGYDAVGNRVAVTDPLGRVTTTAYDALDRATTVTAPDPDGAGPLTSPVTKYGYDAVGNRVAVTDPLGKVTTTAYDALDRATTVTDPRGGQTKLAYDAVGNTVSVTDPVNNRTTYVHDALDRATTVVDPLGKSTTYAYDAVGNLSEKTDRLGRIVQYSYYADDRVKTEKWLPAGGGAAVNTTTYTYDAVGRVTQVQDVASKYSYAYDALDRLTTSDNQGSSGPPQVTLTYDYDANGNRARLADSKGGVTSYAYDALDRLTRITQSGTGVADKRVDMAYDAAGQRASLTRYSDLAGSAQILATTYGYDGIGRVTGISHKTPAPAPQTRVFFGYDYDAASRVVQEVRRWNTDASTDTVTYGYTSDDQLTSVSHANSAYAAENFTYDANGNRNTTGYSTGTGNRVSSDGTYAYAYDDEGNQISRTKISDGSRTLYKWDHRNRLVEVVSKVGGLTTQVVEYAYDALDRRVGETSYPPAASPAAGDAGFEAHSPAGGSGRPPAGASAWTFAGGGTGNSAGVSANGTAFTSGNPAAPEGGQVAYLMGAGSITQNVSGWTAGTYTLSFLAAQRGNYAGNAQVLQVKIDGAVVATITPSGTNYQTYTATFTVSAGAHSVAIVGTVSGHTALLDAVSVAKAPTSPTVGNEGFESASAWTFGGNTGVTGNNNAFTSGNPPAPQGLQVAYVLGAGAMSQNVAGWRAGTYTLSFMAAQRGNYPAGGVQTLQVKVDGVVVGVITPSGTAYQTYSVVFAVAAGDHAISFVGTSATSGTAFIDAVSLKSTAAAAGDAGFESHSPAGGSGRPPAGASAWTFAGGGTGNSAGVSANNTAFTSGNPAAPEGGQVAYLMGAGSITQNVSGWTAGTYTLSFLAAQRGNYAGNAQVLQVKIDGAVVATITPSGTNYRTYTAVFAVSAGAHSVTIAGTVADHTALLDDAALVPTSRASRRWTVYDGDRPILDFDGSGAQTARYLQAGPDLVDEVLARETASGVAWYLGDRLGTIRDLADNTGAIVDHVDYNAFGGVESETAPAVGDRMMGFAGMERSKSTGLNLAIYRVQDPGNGAWLSEDPIGFAARDPNLRRYVGNDPTNAVDPGGLESWTSYAAGKVASGGRIAAAGGLGLAQGALNTANGVQDVGIGVLNTPALAWNWTAGWVAPNCPYIPSPDWSKGRITDEDPFLHDVSKFLGGNGVAILASAVPKAWRVRPANPAVVDFAAESAVVGGKLYGAERLGRLERYLGRRGVTLEVGSASLTPGKAGEFRAALDGTARLLLKADPPSELVWHELGHFIQWRRLGSDAYCNLPRSMSFNAPEQFVFDLLEQPTRWRRLTPEFRIRSAEYIEEVGGFR